MEDIGKRTNTTIVESQSKVIANMLIHGAATPLKWKTDIWLISEDEWLSLDNG